MNHTSTRRFRRPMAGLAAVAFVLAACGGSDDAEPSDPTSAEASSDDASDEASSDDAASDDAASDDAASDDAASDDAASDEATTDDEASTDDAGSEDAATGEPIVVGNISSLTGGALFPEASIAAEAVFERVNSQGGIDGRPLQLVIEDDAGTPEGAATAGRKLVEQDGVVGMVGSASTIECAINSAFYAEQGVYSIQGTGVDPLCFLSPTISPVNTGPYSGVTVSLFYASETLALENICNINLFVIPDLAPAFDGAVSRWEEITGKSLTFRAAAATLEDDPTPLMLQARDAGCDAVIVDGVEPHALAVGRTIEAQGLQDIQWIGLTSYYSDSISEQLGSSGNGLRANSEFEPLESDVAANEDWRALMTEAGVPLTSFSQGGYLAATIFVDAVSSIDGDITRESVAEAMRTLAPVDTPLIGTPYTFGDGETHAPNQASKFVELQDGAWVTVADEWVVLPS